MMFRAAEGIRLIEYGVNSTFRILQATLAIIFGIAISKSMVVSKWIGIAGVIVGVISIAAGLEVAYEGFIHANFESLRGITMIIFTVWVVVLAGLMLKRAMSKKNPWPK
jgi:hypothetical protein